MSKRNSTRLASAPAAAAEAVASYLLTGKVAVVTGSGTFISHMLHPAPSSQRKSHRVLPLPLSTSQPLLHRLDRKYNKIIFPAPQPAPQGQDQC